MEILPFTIGALVGTISVRILDQQPIVRFVSQVRRWKDSKGEENFLAVTYGIFRHLAVIVYLGHTFYTFFIRSRILPKWMQKK